MRYLFSVILIFSFSAIGFSQIDGHYWTNQYGAKGLLLNGAVLAAPDDETSIYYNPGAMPLDDNLGFSFSFLSPAYSRLTTSNFLGDGETLRDDDFGLSPGFAAVRFRPFNTDRIVAGITTFSRTNTNISFKDRLVNTPADDPNTLFRGDLEFERKIDQDWFGIGMAYKITDQLGIGITQFSVWHSERLDFDFKKEILQSGFPENIVQSWRSEFNYDFSVYSSFVTKLGVSFSVDDVCFGLIYTTPSYSPLQDAASYSFENQKLFDTGNNLGASNRNETELLDYKTPRSVGFGFELHMEKMTINFSTEWFQEIPEYTLIEDVDDSFDDLAIGISETSTIVQTGNESVINFGLGIQSEINNFWQGVFGFRTDFNQSNNLQINRTAEYLASTPDVFHVSGGAMYQYRQNKFSFGIDLGYGSTKGGQQLLDLSNVTNGNLFQISNKQNVSSTYWSAMLFITYDFLFKSFE